MIDIKERVEILTRVFGPCQIDRRGINAAFRCPDCGNSKKQKFVVKLDTGQYHCWVCDARGASVAKVMRRLSAEAAARWESVTGSYQRQFRDEVIEAPAVELPNGFRLLAESLDSNDPDARACIEYTRDRGLNLRDLWYFRLGCVRRGRLSRRVIMPSFDADGKLNYWTARSIDKVAFGKYVNPSVPRGEFIFNELNLDWRQELTLVEGPVDLVKCDINTTGNHKDVGEMTKEQFLEAKKKAKPWDKFQGIINLSRITRSGSIF